MGLYIAIVEEVFVTDAESASDALSTTSATSVEIVESETASDEIWNLSPPPLAEEGAAFDDVFAQNYSRHVEELEVVDDLVAKELTLFITKRMTLSLGPTQVFLEAQPLISSLVAPVFFIKNFNKSLHQIQHNIYQSVFSDVYNIRVTLEEGLYSHVGISQSLNFSLLTNQATTVFKIEYKILLDGIDVTDLVQSCSINGAIDSFASDIDITWLHTSLQKKRGDNSLYDLIDCSNIPRNYQVERVEVYTRVATNVDPTWVLQGKFFLEKRGTSVDYKSVVPSSWGRNRTALLALPYAKPLTKVWEETTTARSIAEELCTAVGVSLIWEIADFRVLGSNISVDGEEPINIISTLAGVVGGTLTSTKDGALRVIYRYLS